MSDPNGNADRTAQGLLTKYAHSVGHRPVLSVVGQGWEHVSLERYKVPSFDLRLGEFHVHRVSLHLAGPVLVERTRDGSRDRRWSGLGCTNLVPAGVPVTRSFKGQADFMVACIGPTIGDEVAGEVFQAPPGRVRYLIRLRIDHARHMLEHTRLPVIEVGLRCGFAQTTHFATMFRKITGLCPRAYRAARCF